MKQLAPVLASSLALAACASTRAPTVGERLGRSGQEIEVAGQPFHVGAPVVPRLDPDGYDAYRPWPRFSDPERDAEHQARDGARRQAPAGTGLRGPWLGQELPGADPVLVAPGVVNTDAIEINGVFTPDGGEFLFSRRGDEDFSVFRSVRVDGEWSVPSPLRLYADAEPALAVDMSVSPDGQRLYFLGRHGSEVFPEEPGLDLWVCTREGDRWSTAGLVPPPVSTAASESYPCVVADGSLYFSSDRPGGLGDADVYRAQLLPDGGFAEPVNLGAPVNTAARESDTYVAPDESYLVLTSSRPGGLGESDLYVAFRQADGTWSEPVNLGTPVNSEHTDFCPMVSPDGRVLCFSRRRSDPPGSGWEGARQGDVLWVDASILEAFRR